MPSPASRHNMPPSSAPPTVKNGGLQALSGKVWGGIKGMPSTAYNAVKNHKALALTGTAALGGSAFLLSQTVGGNGNGNGGDMALAPRIADNSFTSQPPISPFNGSGFSSSPLSAADMAIGNSFSGVPSAPVQYDPNIPVY